MDLVNQSVPPPSNLALDLPLPTMENGNGVHPSMECEELTPLTQSLEGRLLFAVPKSKLPSFSAFRSLAGCTTCFLAALPPKADDPVRRGPASSSQSQPSRRSRYPVQA